jgi:signal transduction histidine kinase
VRSAACQGRRKLARRRSESVAKRSSNAPDLPKLLDGGPMRAETPTELAARHERERIARDLHDGLAHELLDALGQARRLHEQRPSADTEHLVETAQRALDLTRAAIGDLRAPCDETLPQALARTAVELGPRLALDVRVSAPSAIEVAPPVRDAVTRIVGEALFNAARHGGAHHAAIELRDGSRRRLMVRDDGRGFDPRLAPAPGSFGLVSMRERAEAFGGMLAVRSAPGAGTEVEVALP